jgi:hypothetical protein
MHAAAYRYRPLLVVLSLASLALSLWLMFQAGCAGDLKTGSLGDPQRALAFEHAALSLFLFGILGAIASIAASKGLAVPQRIGLVAAAVLFGVPMLWLLGIQFEVWGVQHCF